MFYRLLTVSDDFGRFSGKAALIKGRCFPLKDYTPERIDKWLVALHNKSLLQRYELDGKLFIQLDKWQQRQRANASKFPPPPEDDGQVTVIRQSSGSHPHAKRNGHDHEPAKLDAARRVLDALNAASGKSFRPVPANLEPIMARLAEFDERILRGVIVDRCEHWKDDEKMAQYLRPATLFNKTKCAQYAGELPK